MVTAEDATILDSLKEFTERRNQRPGPAADDGEGWHLMDAMDLCEQVRRAIEVHRAAWTPASPIPAMALEVGHDWITRAGGHLQRRLDAYLVANHVKPRDLTAAHGLVKELARDLMTAGQALDEAALELRDQAALPQAASRAHQAAIAAKASAEGAL